METQAKDVVQFSQDLRQQVLSRAEMEEEGAFREAIFTQIALEYLADSGEIEDADVCLHRARGLQISGYALSENGESLDLIVAHHTDCVPPETVQKREIDALFNRVVNFYNETKKGYHHEIEEASPVFDLAQRIYAAARADLSQVRFICVTDGIVKTAPPKDKDLPGIRANFDIWDAERFFRLVTSGRQREAIEIDFEEAIGEAIPCLVQPDANPDYAAYLSIFPAKALVELYGKYGARLLERNVRSFLQARGKINSGMRETIRKEPHMFLAFNNGLSATAEEITLTDLPSGGKAIKYIRDLQIVNGGQTTASIFHAVKKDKADVSSLFVQVKLTVLRDLQQMDEIIPCISKYANSQNKIQEADLAANDKYHRSIEELSRTIWAPAKDGSSRETRWFYERARGQYQDEISRAGTPAKVRDFQVVNPKDQLFTKTDLAKAVAAWDMHPHIVSKGAQACFTWFMGRLKEHQESEGALDQRYFERLVAKLIVFRSAERLIKHRDMGHTGYYANLVAYSVARLVRETGGWIDLGKIWKEQRLSPMLEDAIKELSRAAWVHITNPVGQGNVTQYCKQQKCWDTFLSSSVCLPSTLKKATLPGANGTSPRGTATAKTIALQENVQRVLGVSSDEWFGILTWSRGNNVLDNIQRSLVVDLAALVGNGLAPNARQATEGVKILEEVKARGYRG